MECRKTFCFVTAKREEIEGGGLIKQEKGLMDMNNSVVIDGGVEV